MKTDVYRLDEGTPLKRAKQTEDGYIYFEGRATRAGVFKYMDGKGNAFYELRPPEEVSNPASLATLARKPITDLHPSEFVDSENIQKYSVGTIDGEIVWEHDFEDGYVKVRGVINRKDAVDSVNIKNRTEFSCGYVADIEVNPGVWTDSKGVDHRYDAIQRNIRYNHLALVDSGRAGKEVKLRVDDAYQISDSADRTPPKTTPPKKEVSMKIRIDGREYAADEPAAQRAIDDMVDARTKAVEAVTGIKAKLDASEATLADLRVKLTALEGKAAELDVLKADAANKPTQADQDAARLDWFDTRQALLAQVDTRQIVLDAAITNDEIKRAIVLSRFDEADLPSQAHIDAAFSLMSKEDFKPAKTGDTIAKAIVDGAGAGVEDALMNAQAAYLASFKN